MKTLLLFFSFLFPGYLFAQAYVTRDIKTFGAKGDGKTDDHAAFERAARFFNERGGKGKLVISKGIYRVGQQLFTQGREGKPAYQGADVLHLEGVSDLVIEGQKGAKLKFRDGLRFGAFDPKTGKPYEHGNNYFVQGDWAGIIGNCISLSHAKNVRVKNLELDGNNGKFVLGGVYGDVGRQLPHTGIFIQNSRAIILEGVQVHHFGLDGAMIGNEESKEDDDIKLLDCTFEYNARQGLSWIGGNDLKVKGCTFSNTGQGTFYSSPGAGVDIEAEVGPIRNGKFEDCRFINNKGCGLVADTGDSGFCDFKGCSFWGVDAWSIWVTKPGFVFKDCDIAGSIVHGFNAAREKDATRFVDCQFEDKLYQGREAYGNFLVESNGVKRMSFSGCTFTSNKKKILWVDTSPNLKPDEKYQFENCRFIVNNDNFPKGEFLGVMRGARQKNCVLEFRNKEAKKKGYYLSTCCNEDAGGNKVMYAE